MPRSPGQRIAVVKHPVVEGAPRKPRVKKPPAPPPAKSEIDWAAEEMWDDFDKLCALQCTLIEIAAWFGVEINSLDYRVKQRYGISLSQIWQEKAAHGKISLRRAQFQAAEGGSNALLIWLGKQWLDQREKHEMTGVDGGPIKTSNETTVRTELPPGMTADDVAARLSAALAAVERVKRKEQKQTKG